MIRRREFITLLGGAAAAWPLAARAQLSAMPVVGYLNGGSPGDIMRPLLSAFRQGLGASGYVEGRNVAIEYRWAEGRYDRLPELAADLVRRQVAVICGNALAAQAAKKATSTIPIVFTGGVDPVEAALVPSLNQPGGNTTGVTILGVELGPKRLELLHELVPVTSTVAVLVNPSDPARTETTVKLLQVAARTLGLQLRILNASTDAELDAAFTSLARLQAGGLVIGGEPFFNSRVKQIAALSIRYGAPTVYQLPEFTAAGGLASYGGSLPDAFRLAGVYTGRILKGEKPADMPVQQATKVELVINLKTAKTLGIDVPPALLARADEVIE
jgi:putative ABC transport system substrate-binding protein